MCVRGRGEVGRGKGGKVKRERRRRSVRGKVSRLMCLILCCEVSSQLRDKTRQTSNTRRKSRRSREEEKDGEEEEGGEGGHKEEPEEQEGIIRERLRGRGRRERTICERGLLKKLIGHETKRR